MNEARNAYLSTVAPGVSVMLDAVSAPFCNFSFCALVSILLNINEKVMIEKKVKKIDV